MMRVERFQNSKPILHRDLLQLVGPRRHVQLRRLIRLAHLLDSRSVYIAAGNPNRVWPGNLP